MSENIGYQIGEAIVVQALHEVLVVEADRKREIKAEIARLEKERPETIEAFEVREEKIKELMAELRSFTGV